MVVRFLGGGDLDDDHGDDNDEETTVWMAKLIENNIVNGSC